ncbi:DNA glycosylase AlkZ-like family protein [Dermabacteraceae bacterium P7054]
MARSSIPLPHEISLLRICAQKLVPQLFAPDVTGVVEHLLAVQGQQVSALPHALLARSAGTLGSDVDEAFAQGTLVRHRPMRGTVHVTHARDFHWMRLALKPRYSAWDEKHYAQFGIDHAVAEQATSIAQAAIAQAGGAITRKDLFTAWEQNLATDHLEPEQLRSWCQWLMFRCAHDGTVIEGPMGANQHLFIDATALPEADSPESGFRLTQEKREDGLVEGLVEIARRYVHGHGPVLIDDLAWWAGMTKTVAALCLEAAVEKDPRLGRYRLEGERLLPNAPASSAQERRLLLYMRQDLPDLLASQRDAAAELMFLPSFDEIYVGYANRTCLTDSAGDRLICPARNGMFRPLIIQNGSLVGVRPVADGLQWLAPPSEKLAQRTELLVESFLKRLER